MKIYIAGKITGYKDYKKEFKKAHSDLKALGYKVMNPAVLSEGFTQEEYMHVCYAMIDVCDSVFFLDNWKDSKGAKLEHEYAIKNEKLRLYQGEI